MNISCSAPEHSLTFDHGIVWTAGTNLQNALQVATTIGEDTPQLKVVQSGTSPTAALNSLLASRGVQVTTFADWEAINATELERGSRRGKSREKLATTADLLTAASSSWKSRDSSAVVSRT